VFAPILFAERCAMTPEIVPVDSLHIKLAWLELSADGTFTVGVVAVLILMWLIASIVLRR
jgi:hypothetical protein